MLDVNEMLTIITKELDLYTGERRKTIQLVYTTLSKLAVSNIELNELNKLLNSSKEDINTKKDAIKMVRVLNNLLTISNEEKAENERYLKEIRKKRKQLREVISIKNI